MHFLFKSGVCLVDSVTMLKPSGNMPALLRNDPIDMPPPKEIWPGGHFSHRNEDMLKNWPLSHDVTVTSTHFVIENLHNITSNSQHLFTRIGLELIVPPEAEHWSGLAGTETRHLPPNSSHSVKSYFKSDWTRTKIRLNEADFLLTYHFAFG